MRCSEFHLNRNCPAPTTPPLNESDLIHRTTRRGAGIEKLRNRGDKLRWCERFFQENAVGYAARGPAPDRCPGDVDDRKRRVDLPGLASNFPTIHSALEDNVGHQSPIFDQAAFEKRDGLFTGCCDRWFEAAFGERIFKDNLNIGIVFNDQNQWQLLHWQTPIEPRPQLDNTLRYAQIGTQFLQIVHESEHRHLVPSEGQISPRNFRHGTLGTRCATSGEFRGDPAMKPGCSLEPFPLSAVRLRCRHASPDGTRSRPHFPPELGPFLLSLRSLAYSASTGARNHFPGTTKTS